MLDNSHSNLARPLKILSLPAVLTISVALGIIFIGIREFFYPALAAKGFGVPLSDPADSGFLAIKAARDVTSGVLVLALLALRNRRILAYAVGILTLIPILDGLIVLRQAGWTFTPFILIHWGTAAFMLVIVQLLRKGK